ncbi:MAG TPA: cytidylate kinase-like family protein [Vicinamibacterales bacterium]|nr:cytidylate kinase-like family protein [Vicinamibacterales bacterium]
MSVRVITLEREYGSGGGAIAAALAAQLGWKLWDQLLTDEIARHLGCGRRAVEEREETRDPAYYRLLKAFMKGSFEGSLNTQRLNLVDSDRVREVLQKLLSDIVQQGNCVIVGRGSAYYLSTRPDVFHVFVYAPFEERVRRLQTTGRSEQEAADLAETIDRDRAIYIKQHFHVDWPARDRFHLMVNSAMGDHAAVAIVLDAMARYASARGDQRAADAARAANR